MAVNTLPNRACACAVPFLSRVLFPADPETDLASLLQSEPSLSRFYEFLEEEQLLPGATGEGGDENGAVARQRKASSGEKDALDGVGVGGLFTVFAPTNDALERLERNRAWLFGGASEVSGNTPRGAATGDGGHEGSERTENEGQASSPLREMLAYHIAPGSAQYSRCESVLIHRIADPALEPSVAWGHFRMVCDDKKYKVSTACILNISKTGPEDTFLMHRL